MPTCCVVGCSNSSDKDRKKGITFHRFPQKSELKECWVEAVNRKDWWPSHSSVVCSKHFTEDQIDRYSAYKVRIKENEVPSVFPDIPSHIQKGKKQRSSKDEVLAVLPNSDAENSFEETASTDLLKSQEGRSTDSATVVDISYSVESDHEEFSSFTENSDLTLWRPDSDEENSFEETASTDLLKSQEGKSTDSATVVDISNSVESNHKEFSSFTENSDPTLRSPSSENSVTILSPISLNSDAKVYPTSDKSLKRKLEIAEKNIKMYRKRIRILQQSNRRMKKKISKFSTLIEELEKEKLVEDDVLDIIKQSAGLNRDLLVRNIHKLQGKSLTRDYPPQIRAFALTLHFYSPRAYEFVREDFDDCLPCTRQISRWYKTINGQPGFSSESLSVLEKLVENSSYPLLFSLVMDEMSIRQHVEFDGKDYYGYVNCGTNIEDDVLPLAKEALVFYVVGINSSFKIAVGYFLIDSVNSSQKVNLVIQCLTLLSGAKTEVISFTFDGYSTNWSLARQLGCKFDENDFKTSFSHPVTKKDVYIILDPCHMLKLVRNTLGDKGSIVDENNKLIDWRYISSLNELQVGEGLHLGNKLRPQHVDFKKQKMKVRLATQLLSESVAVAIEYCNKKLKLPAFKGSEATVRFIKIFNMLFDIMNSRSNRFAGFKKPLSLTNCHGILKFLDEAKKYIMSLRVSVNGVKIIHSLRKTGFLGFLVCIESVKHLFATYVQANGGGLAYLPMYKLSQDHLELFFQKIRFHGGWNNNPTARQFAAAYKKLLVHAQIRNSRTGNCLPLEDIKILTSTKLSLPPGERLNITTQGYRLLDDDSFSVDEDHDYDFQPRNLSQCSEDIVHYVAGAVVFYLSKRLKCVDCLNVLSSSTPFTDSLISYKNKGKLHYPSKDVHLICKRCESVFRENVNHGQGKGLISQYTILKTETQILQELCGKPLFLDLLPHSCGDVLDDHSILLTRAIIKRYLYIRFTYWGKNVVNKSNSIRNIYTKLIIFKGQ